MQIDWVKTIEDIFSNQVSCPRCGILTPQLVAGYSRATWAAEYAPRASEAGAAAYIQKSDFGPDELTGAWEVAKASAA